MARIIVRNTGEVAKARLKRRVAVKREEPSSKALGTRIARRFARIGFTDDELSRLRREWAGLWGARRD
jgi:hypothetical protein